MLHHDPINTFLINPNIILYHVHFIKYLWISKISLLSIGLKLTEKIYNSFLIFFSIINCKVFCSINKQKTVAFFIV